VRFASRCVSFAGSLIPDRRPVAVLLVSVLVMFGTLTVGGVVAVAAPTCSGFAATTVPAISTTDNELSGVSMVGPCTVWAAGYGANGSTGKSLIAEFDGRQWTIDTTPVVGTFDNLLRGIAMTSASNGWAVGTYFNGSVYQTLILRWNGISWVQQTTPNVGTGSNQLFAISAVSATRAWAVGNYFPDGSHQRTLILMWNGTHWTVQTSPNPGADVDRLNGVAAVSNTSAWAVGAKRTNAAGPTLHNLILKWDGHTWSAVSGPNLGTDDSELHAVAAGSSTSAWAVGGRFNGSVGRPELLRFSGGQSRLATLPTVGKSGELYGVSGVSATRAVAVGGFSAGGINRTLAFSDASGSWVHQPTPVYPDGSQLNAVDADNGQGVRGRDLYRR
jgi:hypothetical protein